MKKSILCLSLLILLFAPHLKAELVEEEAPVVILGSGVGALTSAVYLSRAGIAPVVITGPVMGGTITQSHQVQNWPGEVAISGVELAEKVKHQAEVNGAILLSEVVVSVDFSKSPYAITTKSMIGSHEQEKRYKTQSVIIALGATPNFLNVPGETGSKGYWARGVYSCAVCDGALYKDKVVTVVGGGDSALIEAQYLSRIASKVHVLLRKGEFRSIEKQRLNEVLSTPNIEVHYYTVVKEIKGDGERVTHLLLNDTADHKNWELPTDALFLAIGSRPNTEMFSNQIQIDPAGYIVLKKHQETSLEGIYAIGDVADPEFKQAVSAAGDAAKAALQAQKYLSSIAPKSPSLAKNEPSLSKKEVIEITSKEQFESELHQSNGVVFVDFYSTYCGPCRTFAPLYENWARDYGDRIKFLKVNANHLPELFREYQIQVVPTLIIFDGKGKVIRQGSGFGEISEVGKRLETIKGSANVTPQEFR